MTVQTRNDEAQSLIRSDTPYPGLLLIGQVTLAAPGLITFPPSGSLPANFRNLLVIGAVRSVRAGQFRDILGARFGTGGGAVDAGANYTATTLQLTNVTPAYVVSITDTAARCGQIDGPTANANAYTGVYLSIPLYQSGFWKQVQYLPSYSVADNVAANIAFLTGAATWRNAGAISSMTFGGFNAWDNLATGSNLALYGVY